MITHSFDVTPDDANDLSPNRVTALQAGGAGDVVVILEKDDDLTTRTFTLAAGEILQGFVIRRVLATGTSATSIVAFY